MSLWLVSVPNEGNRSSETTFLELKAETASTRHDYAGVCRFSADRTARGKRTRWFLIDKALK